MTSKFLCISCSELAYRAISSSSDHLFDGMGRQCVVTSICSLILDVCSPVPVTCISRIEEKFCVSVLVYVMHQKTKETILVF